MNTPTATQSAAAIRQSFLDFFHDRAAHTIVPSAPVVPHDDPTLLFTNAGMNQFKDVFLGTGTRSYSRAVDTQKCIRAGGKHNDLEDVGRDTYHHTFFEMLGNWSFGDYFKAEAISWAWEFLTQVCGLPKDRLYVTVFAGDAEDGLGADEEAAELWRSHTDIDPTHISRWDRKDNFWEMGATGPCGPCSEIHYDSTPDGTGGDLVNRDHPDVIEIWNLVFIQFNRRDDGSLVELPARHIDTGMGLERIVRVMQGARSNYDTDLWTPIFSAISAQTGARPYEGVLDDPIDVAYRVIADHVRCLTVAISDGAEPGPDGRGYVLRRILRRGVRMARQSLGAEKPLLCDLVPAVVGVLGQAFPDLEASQSHVTSIIRAEEEAFLRTLDRGLELFAQAAEEARQAGGRISGEQAFQLHDTFGFPIDLTAQMAEEQQLKLDRDGYESAMDQARARSKGEGSEADLVSTLPPEAIGALEQLGARPTDDSPKYHASMCMGHVKGLWNGHALVEHAVEGERIAVILDRTTFYGEQGGQVGDTGRLVTEADGSTRGESIFAVEDTRRSGGWVLHIGHLTEGSLRLGDPVATRIDTGRRASVEASHTATHALNRSLREILGEGADQRGSLVAPDRLRFDYAARSAPTREQIAAVEDGVRSDMREDRSVDAAELPLDVAERITGVRAIFGERYPDPVRVVCIGAAVTDLAGDPERAEWATCATEFCGGTHLASTAHIGEFIILQEQGLAAGIRRLTAATGGEAAEIRTRGEDFIADIGEAEQCDEAEIPAALDTLTRRLAELELGYVHRREVDSRLDALRAIAKSARKAAAGAARDTAIEDARSLAASSSSNVVVGEVRASDRDSLLAGMDTLRGALPESACLLACRPEDSGKVIIAARVPEAMMAQGLKAGDWVRVAAQACGGGGGGRPDAAQAGGKEPKKLPEALAAAAEHAREVIS